MNKYLVTLFLMMFAQSILADYPEDSIYLLDSEWRTQENKVFHFDDLSGTNLVLSMTYTSCQHTCPTIVSNMQSIENKLQKAGVSNVHFVLVSLMPLSDTPDTLKIYANKRKLEGWTLLSGNTKDVRELAMVLAVKYKAVGQNEISHSNLITILDEEGRIKQRVTGTEINLDQVIEKLRD